jgi:hypothetical protein
VRALLFWPKCCLDSVRPGKDFRVSH